MTPVEINDAGDRWSGRGLDGLRQFYFELCDRANATDKPCETSEYEISRVVRACAEISYGTLDGIRIGMDADLRLPDNSDGFLGFASSKVIR